MSELLFFVALGGVLLLVLFLWARRGARATTHPQERAGIEEALSALRLAVPPRRLAERIFAPQDWGFVLDHAPHPLQREFLRERKRLALAWLAETRRKVADVMVLHRKAVRQSKHLQPAVESGLALHYIFFLGVYCLLAGLIRLRGPFAARRMVGYAADLAEQLSLAAAPLLVGPQRASASRIRAE